MHNFAPLILSICDHPFVSTSGWRGDEVSGYDRSGPARFPCRRMVSEADQPRAACVAQHGTQDTAIERDLLFLRARAATEAEDRPLAGAARCAARRQPGKAAARAADDDPHLRRALRARL